MRRKGTGPLLVNLTPALMVIIWSVPTLGLFISSFRTRFDIQTTGWWNIFPHREWATTATYNVQELGLHPSGVMDVEGVTGTFEELREGVMSPAGGTRVTWVGNRRLGRIEVQERIWTTTWNFSLDNYKQVLLGSQIPVTGPDGTVEMTPGQNMSQAFLNSLAVAVPSTIIPILIAAFAAYAFAWMNFPGRRIMFILVVGLIVVPLQIALVPILRDYNSLRLNGTFLAIWLAHTGFGLALGMPRAGAAAAQAAAVPPPPADAAPAAPPPPPPISGMRLDKVAEQVREHAPPPLQALLVALALGTAMLGGCWWQRRRPFKAKSAFSPA